MDCKQTFQTNIQPNQPKNKSVPTSHYTAVDPLSNVPPYRQQFTVPCFGQTNKQAIEQKSN